MKRVTFGIRPALPALIIATCLLNGIGCAQHLQESPVPPPRSAAADVYNSLVLLYGDPHVHTNLSDGDESPDYALRYARDVAALDWCCLTDHSEDMAEDGWVALDYYRSLPAKYDKPGQFCVLFGYEWTYLVYGHRNIYSASAAIPVVSWDDPRYDDPTKLWKALEGYDVITVPHHPMLDMPKPWWQYINPAMDTCVEFYSKWGMSLYDGNDRPILDSRPEYSVYSAVADEGLRLGFMAGSDTHISRPGSVIGESRQAESLEYSRPGLTAVWATSYTRQAIFEALKARHCYGVTGTRVMLKFAVNGHMMGSETSSEGPPALEYEASSDVRIDTISVMKIHDGTVEEVLTIPVDDLACQDTYVDNEFADDSAYFITVLLENTDMAVCSPVWVEKVHSGDVI